ncbi:hypothetical protein HWI79_1943 [Cryptosporidium felis]|nr:hypothetical protein HWI79_1943 [Cryptosporidium felis]
MLSSSVLFSLLELESLQFLIMAFISEEILGMSLRCFSRSSELTFSLKIISMDPLSSLILLEYAEMKSDESHIIQLSLEYLSPSVIAFWASFHSSFFDKAAARFAQASPCWGSRVTTLLKACCAASQFSSLSATHPRENQQFTLVGFTDEAFE